MNTALALTFGYLLGSVLPADLLARARGIDIRRRGTRNPGATNAWGVLGPTAGVLTGAFDMAKGVAAIAVAAFAGVPAAWAYAAGGMAVVGHVFSLWARFRGGQGTATSTGLMLYCLGTSFLSGDFTAIGMVLLVAVAGVVWLVFRSATMVGAAVLPIVAFVLVRVAPHPAFATLGGVSALYVWSLQVAIAARQGLWRPHAGLERRAARGQVRR